MNTEKDTQLVVHREMTLEISEVRDSLTRYSGKKGFEEITKQTKTTFNWKLLGISAKLNPAADGFDSKKQELYNVIITPEAFALHYKDFDTREKAIHNALEFAHRNGIIVDGYGYREFEE